MKKSRPATSLDAAAAVAADDGSEPVHDDLNQLPRASSRSSRRNVNSFQNQKDSPNTGESPTTTSRTNTRRIRSPKRKREDPDDSIEEEIKTKKQVRNTIINNDDTDPEESNNDVDDESIDTSDDEDEDEVYDDRQREHRKKRKRTKAAPALDGQWNCPKCGKKFGSSLGLQYHVDHFVCQPLLRPGGPVVKGRRKVTAGGSGDHGASSSSKNYKKVRGKIDNRTCPQCHRVFTSVNGLQYHRGTSWQVR